LKYIFKSVVCIASGIGIALIVMGQDRLQSIERMEKSALHTKDSGNLILADSIAIICKFRLNTMNDTMLLTQTNIQFFANFPEIINLNDRIFDFFYSNPQAAEKLIPARPGYSRDLVKFIIRKDMIEPFIYKTKNVGYSNPQWRFIYKRIRVAYGRTYADETVKYFKVGFYRKLADWRKFGAAFNEEIENFRLTSGSNLLGGSFGDSWTLNTTAWDVFQNCNDKKLLKKAVKWINLAIYLCADKNVLPQYLDTKANIFYKMGKLIEAIQFENSAIALDHGNKEFQSTITKMHSNVPTWLLK